jgi:hypothetical protein
MARQAATLAALDERYAQLERLAEMGTPLADLDGLRGRRSILVRHAPTRDHGRLSRAGEECPPTPYGIECGCDLRALICASCRDEAGDPIPWEDCPDWRDAAAGLEVPDGT